MSLEPYNRTTAHLATVDDDRWAKARRYVEAATLFQRASLAAQIMAGMELDALRKLYDVKRGRPEKLPHGVVFNQTWPEAIKANLGVSDQTAYRWIEMAKAARPRLAKSDLELGTILEKHPGALTAAEQELLKVAVHKISDGRTQMEFLTECGSVKAAQGSGAKGGNTREKALENAANATPAEVKPENIGWHEITKMLNNLLTEHLDPVNQYWNQCDEARRRELHGNLLDAAAAVAATLRKETRG